jgi:M6 family metalloprotease-like protein
MVDLPSHRPSYDEGRPGRKPRGAASRRRRHRARLDLPALSVDKKKHEALTDILRTMLRPLARRALVAVAVVVAALAGVAPARALEPPRPGELARYARDGTLGARLMRAERLGNDRVAPGLMRHLLDKLQSAPLDAGRPRLQPPLAWRGMPTTGTVKVLALLIDFSDFPAYNSAASIGEDLFGAGGRPQDTPYESLHSYYERSSYGRLDIQGDVLGWYRPAQPRSAVAQTTAGRERLIRQALTYYEAQGHDFSQYDNDGDGAIDYLMVVWTGNHTGWSGFWWGYQTQFGDTGFTLDGKRLGTYSWQWEVRYAAGAPPRSAAARDFKPEVTIHETGHALGLPDYYDYEPGLGPDGGVGGLDMMDADQGDHNAFSKYLLDWIDPAVMASGAAPVTLRGAAETGDAVLVMPGLGSGPFGEYFLVQNRQRTGNDVGLPADGLLIWHVDARLLDPDGSDFRFDNSYTAHKLLRLMEADGREQIERGGWADAGDYYDAGDALGPTTVPGSRAYNGAASNVTVSGISKPGPVMSFMASTTGRGTGGATHRPVSRVTGGDVRWQRDPVGLAFHATDADGDLWRTAYSVDYGAWIVGSGVVLPAPSGSHAGDGVHVVRYRSEDYAGNLETSKRVTVRIDTQGPECRAPRPARAFRRGVAMLSYLVADRLSPRVGVVIRVRTRGGRLVKVLRAAHVTSGARHAMRFVCRLPRADYRFTVYAHDLAGNRQRVTDRQWLSVR